MKKLLILSITLILVNLTICSQNIYPLWILSDNGDSIACVTKKQFIDVIKVGVDLDICRDSLSKSEEALFDEKEISDLCSKKFDKSELKDINNKKQIENYKENEVTYKKQIGKLNKKIKRQGKIIIVTVGIIVIETIVILIK